MKRLLTALIAFAVLLMSGAGAEAVLINFDDGFSGAIGTHYSSSGIVFDQGWQYSNWGSNVSGSGQAYGEADNSYNGVPSGNLIGHFVLAGTSTLAVTDYVSVWATWLDYGVTSATLSAYGIGGGFLGSITGGGGGSGTGDQVLLSLNIAGIHSFVVSFSGSVTNCTGNVPCDDINAIDDLQFNATSAVPEPSTLVLLGSGLFGLGYYRMRIKG